MPSLGVSSLDFDRVGNDAVFFSASIFGLTNASIWRRRTGTRSLLGGQRSVEEIVEDIVIRHRHQLGRETRQIVGQCVEA